MNFEALFIWSWFCEFKLFAQPYFNPFFCVNLQSNLVFPHNFIQGFYLSPTVILIINDFWSLIYMELALWIQIIRLTIFKPPFCVTLQSNLVSPHYFIQGLYLSPAFTSSIVDVFVLWVCVQTISNIIPCFSCLLERFVKFSLMYSFLILSFLVPLHMHISVTSFFSLLHCPTFNII